MLIKDVMDTTLITLTSDATLQEAAKIAKNTQVSDIMITDKNNIFVGVVSEGDIIRSLIPDTSEILKLHQGKVSQIYDKFIVSSSKMKNKSIKGIILRDIFSLVPDDKVLKAALAMVSLQIRRLPVLEQDKLVGTVSRADVCFHVLNLSNID